MYYYTLKRETDAFIFHKIEELLDENLHNFTKDQLLVDIDGSSFLRYLKVNDWVKLSNDCDVDAVLVDSTIELDFLNDIAIYAYRE